MLMRKTSTAASKRHSIISGAYDAGPRVATILTRVVRLMWLAPPCAGIGQASRPVLRFLRIHLEEAGALIATSAAFLNPPDREGLVGGTHVGFARPFSAAVVVDGVNVIKTAGKRSLVKRLAGLRRNVSPGFRGPAAWMLVASGQ